MDPGLDSYLTATNRAPLAERSGALSFSNFYVSMIILQIASKEPAGINFKSKSITFHDLSVLK